MARLVAGCDDALESLMERHAKRLFSQLRRILRNEIEAQETVQETFVRVYRYRERFDLEARFSTWLYAIAFNLARDQFRRRARQPEFVSMEAPADQDLGNLEEILLAPEPPPDQALEKNEWSHSLADAIASLPERWRLPLVLFAEEDKSQAEIAAQMHCTVKAVEMRMYHARRHLQSLLKKEINHPIIIPCKMKTDSSIPGRQPRGFTLIEMLVVIAILATLAGLLLPVLSAVKTRMKIRAAKLDMVNLTVAIHQYEAEYTLMPASKNSLAASNPDFTFGTYDGFGSLIDANYPPIGTGIPGYQISNKEIIDILRNPTNPLNPRQTPFFTAKDSGNTTSPGVDPFGVFRDPWGNPYIISLDMNGDNRTRDGFYRKQVVSQQSGGAGFYGLSNTVDPGGTGDNFEVNGPIMIWSFGPDGKADPAVKANQGVNKDNILSWQ